MSHAWGACGFRWRMMGGMDAVREDRWWSCQTLKWGFEQIHDTGIGAISRLSF